MGGADNVTPRVPGTLLDHLLGADLQCVVCGGFVIFNVAILPRYLYEIKFP